MMSSYLVPPLARFLGIPARLFGGSIRPARTANSTRNPARTAATAAALMIGLALVTFVAMLAAGLESSTKGDLDRQVTSRLRRPRERELGVDLHLEGDGSRDRSRPRAHVVSGRSLRQRTHLRSDCSVAGIDGATIANVYRFAWKDGSDLCWPTSATARSWTPNRPGAPPHRWRPHQDRGLERTRSGCSSSVPPTTRNFEPVLEGGIISPPPSTDCSRTRRTATCSSTSPGREPVDDRRAREVTAAIQRRDRRDHARGSRPNERHQDDAHHLLRASSRCRSS